METPPNVDFYDPKRSSRSFLEISDVRIQPISETRRKSRLGHQVKPESHSAKPGRRSD